MTDRDAVAECMFLREKQLIKSALDELYDRNEAEIEHARRVRRGLDEVPFGLPGTSARDGLLMYIEHLEEQNNVLREIMAKVANTPHCHD